MTTLDEIIGALLVLKQSYGGDTPIKGSRVLQGYSPCVDAFVSEDENENTIVIIG